MHTNTNAYTPKECPVMKKKSQCARRNAKHMVVFILKYIIS